MNAIFNILIADKDIISYRPELNKITGSVTATILLQQILFRLNGQNEFYKFKEPCQHALYKEGDSWCEELGFTRREFDTAISNLKEKGFIKTRLTMDRITYYSIDECTLGKAISVLYEKAETYFTKSANPPLDNSIIFEETENTSENNITPLSPLDENQVIQKNGTTENSSSKQQKIKSPLDKAFESVMQDTKKLIKNTKQAKYVVEGECTVEFRLPDFIDKQVWAEWVQHRKELKHPITPKSLHKQLKQLTEWNKEGQDVNEIIEMCIANGYRGLFPIRQGSKPKNDNDGWSFKPLGIW